MFDFTTVTEVKLAQGNHSSPSQGMCFMEMVAWFAGEAHSDKPACACPVLGAYGIGLNDRMPADQRDRLLKPLVPLIAGTVGTRSDQRLRAEFLALWTVNRLLPITLRAVKLEDHAVACETATDIPAARAAADAAYAAADAAYAAADADAAAAAADAYAAADADAAADAEAREQVFTLAVEGLRQAILIGPHEGFSLLADLPARHAALRDLVAA